MRDIDCYGCFIHVSLSGFPFNGLLIERTKLLFTSILHGLIYPITKSNETIEHKHTSYPISSLRSLFFIHSFFLSFFLFFFLLVRPAIRFIRCKMISQANRIHTNSTPFFAWCLLFHDIEEYSQNETQGGAITLFVFCRDFQHWFSTLAMEIPSQKRSVYNTKNVWCCWSRVII